MPGRVKNLSINSVLLNGAISNLIHVENRPEKCWPVFCDYLRNNNIETTQMVLGTEEDDEFCFCKSQDGTMSIRKIQKK